MRVRTSYVGYNLGRNFENVLLSTLVEYSLQKLCCTVHAIKRVMAYT